LFQEGTRVVIQKGRLKIHCSQSISGALKNWSRKDWERVAADNGTTAVALKEKFRIWEFEGKKVLPLSDECEGFSYETGCPGHPIKEET